MTRLPEEDLAHVLEHTKDIWKPIKNKSIFITGATGFFGKWLLETFIYINKHLGLNTKITALSRNPDLFLEQFPFYKEESNIKFIKGNIQNFHFPQEKFHYIIHAATDSDAKLNTENPLLMLDTIIQGTRRILDFAKQQPSLDAFLLTSSGAVYGKQPEFVTHTKETDSFFIDINHPRGMYAEGKRLAELYCAVYYQQYFVPVKIARCFAFVGPYLPLDKHFAIGNFILNGLNNEDIIIKGDGSPHRSYLYAADLAIWLWTILIKGEINIPYNVGADESYSIKDIAGNVSSNFENKIKCRILTPISDKPIERYVPNIDLVKNKLNLRVRIELKESIAMTKKFYQ